MQVFGFVILLFHFSYSHRKKLFSLIEIQVLRASYIHHPRITRVCYWLAAVLEGLLFGKIFDHMGRGKHEHCWSQVTKVENGQKWKCNYCKEEFSGGASRINAHLTGNGGGIRKCSKYLSNANEGVNNNMASTSTNPPQPVINTIHVTHDQVIEGALEVIDAHTSSLINQQNNVQIVNSSQGVNGSGPNRSVCESEINQLVLDLDFEKKDIEKQLQCLESRGKKRKSKVGAWLEELREIKESARHMNNLNNTHDISEFIQNMKRHKEEKPLTLSTEYVGRELDENIKKVLKLVDDDKVVVIGIYGMGGVGKTLLATLVENEVKRKTTLKDVFWITVSDNTNISKLQHDIAKRIGVKLDDEDDERIRSTNLSLALETKEKCIIILEDVWNYIDLQKVGIPLKVNGIKVILTTRLKHVCHQMDCLPNHMIQMIPLSIHEDEDWDLFEVKLGHNGTPITLSPEIVKIAKDIVSRCHGLPLGINVIARTMKGIDDIHQWKHALNKLKKVEMGQEFEEEVLKVLKRSYDNLMDKDLQNCFLFCALLSDYVIGKDELIMKLVDSGHINRNMCLEEIFDEGNTILNKLEAHSLICFNHDWVFTHPLVRSMAFYILKKSQRNVIVEFNERMTKISLSHRWATDLELVHILDWGMDEISEGLSPNCPKLSTLILNKVSISHVPDSFFKYMNSLSLLDLSNNDSLESLPNSITNLRSLVSLLLEGCCSLTHVPPLGELQALSRLVISHTSIEEAPQGLEKLINLKWLDLSWNPSLNFELGSFSLTHLTKLQYLNLQGTCALIMLEDVKGMKMLECLRGAIDCKLHNQSMQHNLDMSFGIIKTYHLILGNVCGKSDWGTYINLISFFPGDAENRCIEFQDCDGFTHILPKNHTLLRIYKNNHWVWLCDALSYSTSSSSSVRTIKIDDCHKLESLFCLFGSCSFCTNIHKLEVLKLERLKSLTVICKDVGQSLSPGGIFSCLKQIYICNCHLIEKLLTPQLIQQLQNLEKITVWKCDSMKEIFEVSNNDDNEDSSTIPLPKLTRLELWYLRELENVCKGSIRWGSSPKVTLNIKDCPKIDKTSLERHPTIEINYV